MFCGHVKAVGKLREKTCEFTEVVLEPGINHLDHSHLSPCQIVALSEPEAWDFPLVVPTACCK